MSDLDSKKEAAARCACCNQNPEEKSCEAFSSEYSQPIAACGCNGETFKEGGENEKA
jgi:hypothetical protein